MKQNIFNLCLYLCNILFIVIIVVIIINKFNKTIYKNNISYKEVTANNLTYNCNKNTLPEHFEPYDGSYTNGFSVNNILCSDLDISRSLNTTANITFYNTTETDSNKTDKNKTITISKDGNISGVNNISVSNEFKISNKDNIKINNTKLLDIIYPIGCIFTTTDKNFRPATAFGGDWVNINEEKGTNGKGSSQNGYRFLVATDTETDPAIGGSQYISVDNMPSHNHTFSGNLMEGTMFNVYDGGFIRKVGGWCSGVFKKDESTIYPYPLKHDPKWSYEGAYNFKFEATPSGTISNTGKGTGYWPLYYRVYYWKRIG